MISPFSRLPQKTNRSQDFASARRLACTLSLSLADETELQALELQATKGPNKANRPSSFNIVGCLKHDAWLKLKTIPKKRAKKLYVMKIKSLMSKRMNASKEAEKSLQNKENFNENENIKQKAQEKKSAFDIEKEFYQRYLTTNSGVVLSDCITAPSTKPSKKNDDSLVGEIQIQTTNTESLNGRFCSPPNKSVERSQRKAASSASSAIRSPGGSALAYCSPSSRAVVPTLHGWLRTSTQSDAESSPVASNQFSHEISTLSILRLRATEFFFSVRLDNTLAWAIGFFPLVSFFMPGSSGFQGRTKKNGLSKLLSVLTRKNIKNGMFRVIVFILLARAAKRKCSGLHTGNSGMALSATGHSKNSREPASFHEPPAPQIETSEMIHAELSKDSCARARRLVRKQLSRTFLHAVVRELEQEAAKYAELLTVLCAVSQGALWMLNNLLNTPS